MIRALLALAGRVRKWRSERRRKREIAAALRRRADTHSARAMEYQAEAARQYDAAESLPIGHPYRDKAWAAYEYAALMMMAEFSRAGGDMNTGDEIEAEAKKNAGLWTGEAAHA